MQRHRHPHRGSSLRSEVLLGISALGWARSHGLCASWACPGGPRRRPSASAAVSYLTSEPAVLLSHAAELCSSAVPPGLQSRRVGRGARVLGGERAVPCVCWSEGAKMPAQLGRWVRQDTECREGKAGAARAAGLSAAGRPQIPCRGHSPAPALGRDNRCLISPLGKASPKRGEGGAPSCF